MCTGAIATVPAASARPVVRCEHCSLNQFLTLNGRCRRCRKLFVAPPAVPCAGPAPAFGAWIGPTLRLVRLARGLSQRDLAARMGVPRTYISKLDCGKTGPTVRSFLRVAAALDLPAADLARLIEVVAHVQAAATEAA